MIDDVSSAGEATPLVSIVMLAFNQQDLVAESIASLLAQDYPNYELVVSDDNSTDGTFEAMQAAVAGYTGPVSIRLNKTTANRGILSHFYEAVSLSRGRFIVAAGGDDISLPNRVSRLVEVWQETAADAVFSGSTVIDINGRRLLDYDIWLDQKMQSYFPGRVAYKISGAMAAYDRSVFESIALPEEPVYCEDIFFSLMLHYQGRKVHPLNERLVCYRNHGASMTNSYKSDIPAAEREKRAGRLYRDFSSLLANFMKMVNEDRRMGRVRTPVDLAAVAAIWRYYDFAANWTDMAAGARFRRFIGFRSAEQIRWALPRLLGLGAFARMKALQQVIRRAV